MQKNRKTRVGRVVGDKMNKTVVVSVETPGHHPLYKKIIKKAVKYKVHDENSQCRLGDLVRIIETRPLSKDKRWRIAEIVTKGQVAEVKPEEIT